jgi:hypothetical protein
MRTGSLLSCHSDVAIRVDRVDLIALAKRKKAAQVSARLSR